MMKLCARMVGYVAMAMVLCAILFNFAGTWFGKEGSAPRLARSILLERRRSRALQSRIEVSEPSLMAKNRIIADLVGGRLRLCEAIDQFQRLNKELIEDLAREDMDREMVAAWVPPPTDPKSVGQQVLQWVRAEVTNWPPDKAEQLLADFEREFRELFGEASLSDSSTDTESTRQDVGWSNEPHREPPLERTRGSCSRGLKPALERGL